MEYEAAGLLHEQFVRQALRSPSALAIVSPEENKQVTFGELNAWTDILAVSLHCCGVREETTVGIYLDKGVNFAAAYIAILKAGAGYLPIDTSYPEHMLESVITDAQPVAIITCPSLAPNLAGYPSEQVVSLADGWQTKMEKENKDINVNLNKSVASLDSLAYTVYSSGTTGKPKGIMCPHRGAVFSYHHRHVTYPYEEEEREACNIFFVWEMLRPLMKGVPMFIVSNQIIYDPALLCEFLREHAITRMLFTPSLLETILNTTSSETLKDSFKSFQ
jgi:non-ribosomal peptide synthetase component F